MLGCDGLAHPATLWEWLAGSVIILWR
jgi:hypothetical protein